MVGSRPVYVEKKPKYISVFMFFVLCVVFLKYFPLLPLTVAPPRSLNRSKIFFLIIKMIQNIYCMAIYQENMSSGDELFLIFCKPEIEENQKFITRSIQLVYPYLFHISTHYLYSPYHKPNKDPSFYHIQHLPASLFSKENRRALET